MAHGSISTKWVWFQAMLFSILESTKENYHLGCTLVSVYSESDLSVSSFSVSRGESTYE